MARIKFENQGTHEGVTAWWIYDADGAAIGEMDRERGLRYTGEVVLSGRGGYPSAYRVTRKDGPWEWSCECNGQTIEIPAGSSFRQAAAVVRAALEVAS